MEKRTITTQEEARQYAIDWQNWASNNRMYMSEMAEWQEEMLRIALDWGLAEEFKENGII